MATAPTPLIASRTATPLIASRTATPLIASRDTSSDLIDLGLLAVAAFGAALAILLGAWPIAIATALPSLVADVVRGERPPKLRRIAQRILLDPPSRSLVRNGLVVAALAATARDVTVVDLAALFIAVLGVHLGRVAYVTVGGRAADRQSARIIWRNFEVEGASEGPAPFPDAVAARVRIDGIRAMTAGEAALLIGVALTALGLPGGAIAGALLSVLIVVAGNALGALAWRSSRTERQARHSDDELQAAIERLAPEVVFYFSSPASGTYALGVWVDVINRMRRPTLVIIREAVHLAGVEGITAPIVVPTTAADLDRVVVPSIRVVLYPTNVVKNNDMIRIPGPMHSFIGHGDSDKVGSFSPLNRMYDEIWVAGQAAIDRYAAVDEGIDMAGLRAVGRPQLAEIARAGTGAATDVRGRLTLLYAPTWEGFFDEADYSSVARMGVGIVRTALDAGFRVLFKPHPLTGFRLPAALAARQEIEAVLARAGDGSALVPPGPDSLYTAFNEADVLASDISSVITDFLASRKPYIVTNKHDVPRHAFVQAYPSSGAAYLVGSALTELPDALSQIERAADGSGVDALAAARDLLSAHLLGDHADPLDAFRDEVDGFVQRSAARARTVSRAATRAASHSEGARG